MSEAASVERRRKAWRYSLRGLLVLIAIIAVLLGSRANRFYRERQAAGAIMARGGSVFYHDESYGIVPPERTLTAWWREYWGLRWPGEVSLSGGDVSDHVLVNDVLPLRSLSRLSLIGTAVTHDGLGQLAPLKSLKSLTYVRTRSDLAVLDELRQNTMIEMELVPLEDCVAYLVDLHGIPIEIDEPAAAIARADPRLTISGTYKNRPLAEVLDAMLEPQGWGWAVSDGKLMIAVRLASVIRRGGETSIRKLLPQVQELTAD
ncbi:MAG: hypothetical protein AB7O59_23570 [Pirellulales bacterium]